MFQNINEDTIEINNKAEKAKRNVNIFSNVLTKENLAIYVVAFMMSLVGIGGDFSIFSISVLGACFASSVPALGVVAVSLLGNFIKFGVGGGLGYFLTTLVLIITLFIFKPRYNEEERNEKIKIGKNVFIATLLIQIVKIAMAQFTLYDVLASITLSIIALVFYKIFVNSIVVVQEFYEKRAFSIEEVIGASLMLAIAVGGIGDFSVAGFSIRNILSILIVMVLGWKNGMLIGTTSGVTIGVTLGVITNSEPIMIAAYAISGMIAGILNRFGKIGVVVGFALGNILLAYVANGYTVELIHFKEILIASIGLLFVPKTLQIDIEEFTGKSKLLPSMSDRALNKSKEVAESLNNVSNAINEMATTYRGQDDLDVVEKDNISSDENKEIFIGELLNNLEPYKDNMLYDDIAKADGEIDNEIFELLLEKQEISRKDLLQIFANCNSYIVGAEDNKISKQLEDNIMQIVRTINVSYKVAKSNFIWKKKEEQTKKNISNQLKNVSNAIKSMAKDIEKDIKAEEKYQAERLEIVDLLRQKEIEVQDIMIKKDNRFIVEIYLTRLLENTKLEQIAEILTNILKESIVLNAEATVGKKIVYLSDDKYIMAIGMAQETKNNSKQSGDSILNIRLKDGKYLVAISDGMGSGKEAKNSSNQTLRLLENLLVSGFEKKASLDLINNALMNQNKETFATLDIAIVDLYEGNVEFIKSAACPTYIKKNKRVQMIKSNSLPTGILEESKLETFDKDINDGEIVVLCSDGILDSNVEYKNKELWIKYLLEDIETTNTQKIANLILEESVDNNYGIAKDDMSVVAFKFRQK
jgi:stage II sporulation protein E